MAAANQALSRAALLSGASRTDKRCFGQFTSLARPVRNAVRNAVKRDVAVNTASQQPVFRTRYPDFSTLEPTPNSQFAVPRFATLDQLSWSKGEIREDADVVDCSQSTLMSLLSLSVMARSDLLLFETFVGRFAMVAFSYAFGEEVFQGHSVISTLDYDALIVGYTAAVATTVVTSVEVARWLFSSVPRNIVTAAHEGTREWLLSGSNFLLPPEDSLTETLVASILEDIDFEISED